MKRLLLISALLPACGAISVPVSPQVAETTEAAELAKIELPDGQKFGWLVDRYVASLGAKPIVKEAGAITGNAPGTVGAPDPFGTRVADSLTSFQSILGISLDAINVSDDQKSVTVDFNPLKVGPFGAIKLSAQITEPKPHSLLVEQVREAQRSAVEESLEKGFSDFDDVVWSLTYGYQTRSKQLPTSQGNLWGRNPKLYEGMAGALFLKAWEKGSRVNTPADDQVLEDLGRELEAADAPDSIKNSAVEELTPKELRSLLGEAVANPLIARIKLYLAENLLHSIDIGKVIADANLDALGDLIDNQPTATITLSYRDTAELVGQQSFSGTVRIDMGSWNVNRVFKEIESGKSLTDAYAYVVDQKQYLDKDRFSFELSYKRIDALDLTLPYVEVVADADSGEVGSFDRVAEYSAPEAEEWSGKFQYSRSIIRQTNEIKGADIHPRFDVSIEYKDASGDPMRTKTRLIAKASYQLPLTNGLSLPLALTWSNRPEFLGEQDAELSAHLGLSYGLDRLFEKIKGGS